MRVHLGGHLAYYHPQKQNWFEVQLPASTPVSRVLEQLGIPAAEIVFAVVNGEVANIENTIVQNEDVIQFFPPMDGG